ncbi:unnamed protein product [Blepharisma stoltei]|uniref:O-acyltransferase n=1 Tax=Blepharisma stoltei TaxID=1481888 RepID=A0AAU9ITL8_9CILI|nr:unnamed protein product [Blepharisma stoltei]
MSNEKTRALCYTKVQPSYFDIVDHNAGFYKSDMRGFYIMFTLISSGYIGISAFAKFTSSGVFVEDSFFRAMLVDFEFVILIWPAFSLYCWLAFLLQLMILRGFPTIMASIFQHFTQTLMFIATFYLVVTRGWGFSQTLFACMLTLTHFMKMHSYTMVNRDLREAYLADKTASHVYPTNITVKNFWKFMITPAIVYQPSYPQIPAFRTSYFIQKVILVGVQLAMQYMIATDHILPVVKRSSELSIGEMISRLIVPVLIFYFMIFLILFEQILNLFGELALFGDREFYSDWWNASTYEEFNRKWNRPVHLFLHKHIYQECRFRHKLSEQTSKFFTFAFSAVCHEMVLALICRNVKPYLLVLMIFQVPLIIFQRFINKTLFGMYFVWSGMIIGLPLLLTLYTKASY